MSPKPAHGGCPPNNSLIDFSSNLHPEPPPESVLRAAREGVDRSSRYPEADSRSIRLAFSERLNISSERILMGPGSSALLYQILLCLRPKTVLLPTPCFSEYPHLANIVGAKCIEHPLPFLDGDGDLGQPPPLPRGVCVILSNPCNPTGKVFAAESIRRWMRAVQAAEGLLILDEAYADFKQTGQDGALAAENFPLIILRSPLKFFSLPGLRAGMAILPAALSEKVESGMPPWPLSTPALKALEAAFRIEPSEIHDRRRKIRNWADIFQKAIHTVPEIAAAHSDVHFFLIRLPTHGPDACALADQLSREGMWIRTPEGMPALSARDIRVSTRFPEENGKLIGALKRIYSKTPAPA